MFSRMRPTLLSGVAMACVFGGAASTGVARAADMADPPGRAKQATEVETLIVTAERRAQNLQDVPIAVTALAGESLDRQGIASLSGLQRGVPSLRFGATPAGGENIISLRGLSSQNPTPGGDSPVSFNIDGVPIGRTSTIDPEFFDVDRIEVLRGPQGTLYGRNSVGGAINVITRGPSHDLGGEIDGLVGNYNARVFRGWANVPLYQSGDLGVFGRLTVVSSRHDAYQKNLSTAPTATHVADALDYQMLRGQLLFEFSPTLRFLLVASTYSNDAPGSTKVLWGALPNRSRYVGDSYLPDLRLIRKDHMEVNATKGDFVAGTLNWDLGPVQLTSVTGYAKGRWYQTMDGDGSNLNLVYNNFWKGSNEQVSEELRLSSNADSALKWIAGAIFYRETVSTDYSLTETGLNAPPFSDFLFTNGGKQRTTSYAAFAQGDLDLARTGLGIPMTVTLGLRYSDDHKTGPSYLNFCIPSLAMCFPAPPDQLDAEWNALTGKFGLAYKLNGSALIYGSASRGYLAGGRLLGIAAPFQPEFVWSYEAGFKTEWFDKRLQLNLAAFREEISRMQVFISGVGTARIDNAAGAHVNGLELEWVALPLPGLRLNGAVSLLDGRYDNYSSANSHYGAGSPLNGVVFNYSGNRLNHTPAATASIGAEYKFISAIGELTPRIDVFYSSRVYFKPDNAGSFFQKPYTTTNLRLIWRPTDRPFSMEAFVANLEDQDVVSDSEIASPSLGLGVAPDDVSLYPPRTYGVRITATF